MPFASSEIRSADEGLGAPSDASGKAVSESTGYWRYGFDSPDGPIYAGMPNGVIIDTDGLATVYHAGDTDVFGDMKLIAQLFEPKVCILPVGDYFTMGAKGAAMAAEMLQPSAIIPIHYKTFPVLSPSADEFQNALPANLKERLVAAEIGQDLAWTATGIG